MKRDILPSLNSATKYPSIPTYHTLGEKGRLQDECIKFIGPTHVSEKIDGTNVRIIILAQGGFLIGSREDLLYYSGDVLHNPSMGIVDGVREIAAVTASRFCSASEHDIVIYGELFGGKIGKAAKVYADDRKTTGFRVFDIASIRTDAYTHKTPEEVASWRENGGQYFCNYHDLTCYCEDLNLDKVPDLIMDSLPTGVEEMYEALRATIENTNVTLRGDGGRAEGVVVRSFDRTNIAKIRFEDYERTLKSRK